MFRFVALVDGEQKHDIDSFILILKDTYPEDGEWNVVYENDRTIVFCQGTENGRVKCHIMEGKSGLVMGYLFHPKPHQSDHTTPSQVGSFINESETKKIVNSAGKYLIDNYWGSYVSFIKDGENSLIFIRSPFCQFPVYLLNGDGKYLLFSDPSMSPILNQRRADIDWQYVSDLLKVPYSNGKSTAIKNISYLESGKSLILKMNSFHESQIWDIRDYYYPLFGKDIEIIKSELRNITIKCFEAWSNIIDKSLLELSGGFDSSLVAAGMSSLKNKADLVCVNFYTDSHDIGDERDFARAAARKAGYKLIEERLNASNIDVGIYDRLYPRPSPFIINPFANCAKRKLELAAEYGASSMMTGDGGDGLFGYMGSNAAGLDYILENGPSFGMLSAAMQSARASDISFWSALGQMFLTWIKGENRKIFEKMGGEFAYWGINKELLNTSENVSINAIIDGYGRGIPPGKAFQIMDITGRHEYYSMSPDMPLMDTIRPLLSQPIAEFCIKIPYYIHQFDGRDRGLARAAFADILAREVRLRQFKSNGNNAAYVALHSFRDFYVDYLLDGVLAKRGMIDRQAIELARKAGNLEDAQFVRIIHLASVEAWARVWAGSPPGA